MENSNNPTIKWGSVMLDCASPKDLADFYAELLGGTVNTMPFTDEWAEVKLPETAMTICCQKEEFYKPPVWPATNETEQQMMLHLDFATPDLGAAVKHALSLGATMAAAQFSPPDWPHPWKTMIDPAGHPFDLTQS